MNWKNNKFKSISLILVLLIPMEILAQETEEDEVEQLKQEIGELNKRVEEQKPGISSFLLTGFTNVTYHLDLEVLEDSRFDHLGFAQILLWRPTERLFFEAELEVELEGGSHGGEFGDGGDGGDGHGDGGDIGHSGSSLFGLGYANMVYFLNDYITLTAGQFLSPVGTYSERFHPTWINPLPIDPLGFGHGGPLPTSELGIQARGGLQTGNSKINYSVYVSNGPILEDGAEEPDEAGTLIYSNFSDNNGNKAVGGRISWLPFSKSTLEIGLSGQFAGKVGDAGGPYEDVGSQLLVGDLSYIINSTALKGYFRVIGQYSQLSVDDAIYANGADEIAAGEPATYTFDNKTTFYYGLISYRPSKSGSKFIRNSELVYRYDSGSTPDSSNWALENTRSLFGYNYWLQARAALKTAVVIGERESTFYIQWALGF